MSCVHCPNCGVLAGVTEASMGVAVTLKEVLELIEVATQTLSVEDYGDALRGAQTRLQGLHSQFKAQEHRE